MIYKSQKDNYFEIIKISEQLGQIRDVDSLLDRILSEARKITNADAGSIYLKKGDSLSFEYVQNDTLMKNVAGGNKYLYTKQVIPIDDKSIAGYVAAHKTFLRLDDVYNLDKNVPYTFNRNFDKSSSYHTQSVLTVPLITSRDKIIGVMQIINARDEEGNIIPFSKEEETLVTLFANMAASAIERAQMTREIILRMIKIAELRDPEETTLHVQRVAAYSIEIYEQWAQKKKIPSETIKNVKDILRIASMLHDVGKVAISDSILKKKQQLDDDERKIMKLHTIYGAQLFVDSNSDWDDMAAEIALNHHEKWDGTGYPGFFSQNGKDISIPISGKKGTEIPLSARIVSLADVYDALISPRYYKNAWNEENVLAEINDQKGRHFDPEILDAFFEIYPVIKAIKNKYSKD